MSDNLDLEMDDDLLSASERQQLYDTTTKKERALLIGYASNYKEKYREKLLTLLTDMKDSEVDLNLINKYAYERLMDKGRAYEIIYEFVDKVNYEHDYGFIKKKTGAPAAGITQKKTKKRRNGAKRNGTKRNGTKRRRQKKSRRR